MPSNYPDDLRYSREHEWVKVDGSQATIGITSYAAGELGDIVFVEAPQAGAQLKQFAAFGVVESVKAVSDLFAPISGEVTEVNDALADKPELLNTEPFGDGWIAKLTLSDPAELDALLDAEAYAALIGG
jgi:glycine cleavage system H protein